MDLVDLQDQPGIREQPAIMDQLVLPVQPAIMDQLDPLEAPGQQVVPALQDRQVQVEQRDQLVLREPMVQLDLRVLQEPREVMVQPAVPVLPEVPGQQE